MHDHAPEPIERSCDVAIVGGSAAGLAAALQLGRQRRTVIVVDDGTPRNAPAAHMHGFLGHEGISPDGLAAAGRAEVRSFGVEVLTGHVEEVTCDGDGPFAVRLAAGHTILARRVLAATGLRDELPAIDGLEQRWGREVVHCPFCHGYEVRDRRIVMIVTDAAALRSAGLWVHLSPATTVVLHDVEGGDDPLAGLVAAGVDARRATVTAVTSGRDGSPVAVELAGGGRIDADAVAVGTRFRARTSVFAALGLHTTPHVTGLGDVVQTDPTGATAVAGLYAAGNVTDPSHQVLTAAAEGSRVGAMIAFDLAAEDLRRGERTSGNRAEWDRRYGGEQIWSGRPNGSLVAEVGGLGPGRALDVGAGEGGDAMWLAEQGWTVVASDLSSRALGRIASEATRRHLPVACHLADANGLDPFDAAVFDLVSASYASIPRTPDDRGVANIVGAVAPGGTLVVVSHDLAHIGSGDGDVGRPFDAAAFVQVEDFVAALAGDPGWEIQVHETRPRPPGAASAAHHVEDVVLRARRSQG